LGWVGLKERKEVATSLNFFVKSLSEGAIQQIALTSPSSIDDDYENLRAESKVKARISRK
jgi:hypothetical protein